MNNRKLVTLAIALTIMAASCSDETLTLTQYFDRFAAITSVMDQKTQDLQAKADSALVAAKTDAERLQVLRDSLEEQLAVVGAAVAQWNSLAPPDEVKAAHDAYVAAVDAYVKGVTDGLQGFDRFKTMQEAQDAILTPELQQTGTAIDSGCAKLQGIAASQEVQVDLGCTGGSSANAGG